MRPNKGEHRILEHREVYHKAKQGDGVAHALKSLKLPKGLGTAFLKGGGAGRAGVAGYMVCLCTVLQMADDEAAAGITGVKGALK